MKKQQNYLDSSGVPFRKHSSSVEQAAANTSIKWLKNRYLPKYQKKASCCATHPKEPSLKFSQTLKLAKMNFDAQAKLDKLPKNSSAVRLVNRCTLTGRPRATIRKFGLSRISFRELALQGKMPGVIKSSW